MAVSLRQRSTAPEVEPAMLGLAGPDSAGTAAGTAATAAHSSQRAGAASGPAVPRAGQAGQPPGACGTQAAWTAAAWPTGNQSAA